MSRGRMILASVVIGTILIVEIAAMITFEELFPFGPFPMFAYPQHKMSAVVMNGYGVPEDGSKELPLMPSVSTKYTFPQDGRLLQWNFEKFSKSPEKDRLFEEGLRNLLERYEAARVAGRHDGPKLRSIRVYRETWTLYFDAHNKYQPDKRELVAEYPAEVRQ